MKKIMSFAILFILFIGSSFGIFHYYFYQDANFQQIVVVVNRIDANSIIAIEDIALKKVYKSSVYDHYCQTLDEVVGYYTDYYQVLNPDEMIEKSRIKSIDLLKESVHFKLLSNQTTFSVQVDLVRSGGNTFVKSQKVDVYGVIKPLQHDPIVDVVLKNVRILSVLDRNGQEIRADTVPAVINVAVDSQYVGLLSKLQKMGSIELYARNNFKEKSESELASNSLILKYLMPSN